MSVPRWTCASKMRAPSGSSRWSSSVHRRISSSARRTASSTGLSLCTGGGAARKAEGRIGGVSDVLIVGDSLRSPEMRHEVPVAVPDPFVYVERNGQRVALVSSLEAVRLEEAGQGLDVRTYERYGGDELALSGLLYEEVVRETAARLCEELGVRDAVVPPSFPLEIADRLREMGVQVRADRNLFVERRRVKNDVELVGIRRAQA